MTSTIHLGKYRGEGRVDKQTGGPGQMAHCVLELEASERGAGFEFVSRIANGAIPREYVPSIEKGVRAAMSHGPLAGFPVVDVRVTVVDGRYHAVDSSDQAFAEAARLAFRDACRTAPMILLEPVGLVEVTTPGDYLGAVIGDLNRRHGGRAGARPGRRDVRLHDRPAVADPGPGVVLDDCGRLRGGSRSRQPADRRTGGVIA